MFFKVHNRKLIKCYQPWSKTILILSPHPDDDVIGMGATLYVLAKKNNIKIFYLTSGFRGIKSNLSVLGKTHIRRIEAINSAKVLGIPRNSLKFLNLPFYNTGKISSADRDILGSNLYHTEFDYIYVCGDFKDPHRTHYKCFKIFKQCIKKCKLTNTKIFLYKGIWNDFNLKQIDYIFNFEDDIMDKKIKAIKAHRSQLEPAYPQQNNTPFWQKVIDLNKVDKNFFSQSKSKYVELFSELRM